MLQGNNRLTLEKLQEKDQFLQNIIYNMFDLVSLTDMEGNFKFVGSSHKILGYDLNYFIGKNVMDFVHPEDLPEVSSIAKKFLTGQDQKESKAVEYRYRCADGSYLWFETVGVIIYDEKEKPKEMLFTTRNITDRKQAEEKLKETNYYLGFYQLAVDSMQDYKIAVLDTNYRYKVVSQQYLLLYNFCKEEIVGKSVAEVMGKEAFEKVIKPNLDKALKGHTVKYAGWFYFPAKGHRYLDVSYYPIKDEDQKVFSVAVISRDTTERKQAEDELLESERRAQRQRAAIVKMALDESIVAEKTEEALKRITEVVSEAISVERVSIWTLSEDGLELRCLSLYEAGKRKHSKGTALKTAEFPRYFEAIYAESRINAEDAQGDSRTGELREGYLEPWGITSLLDAGILLEGNFMGVVSLEHTGEKRKWHSDEEAFVSTVASLIAQIFANIERKQVEEELKESEASFKTLFNNAGDAILNHDIKGNLLEVNQKACEQLGYTRKELVGMKVQDIVSPEYKARVPHRIRLIEHQGSAVFETSHTHKDGRKIPVEINARFIHHAGEPAVMSIARDITERKRYEEQLKYLSLHDQLTGLYNRTFFEEEMRRLNNSREHPVSIISADLDGLKLINDTIGHEKGDELLKLCAEFLKKTMRSSDIIARAGGDEFAVILPRTDSKTGEEIIKRINSQVERYNLQQQGQMYLSVSVGLATSTDENKSLEETFKEADDLMYRDKLHKGVGAKSQIIQSLMVTLRERDFITEGHARRLEKMCLQVGKKLNMSKKQLSDLSLLAHIHDLGKVGIPDRILFKPGPLTEEEWKIMRQHSEKGYRIALSSSDLSEIAELILKHHEWWDGGGYPLGLKGEEIPVQCRILSIVDAYDAMTNDRPYSKAMSEEEAIAELKRCAGSQFDPKILKIFLSIINKE